MSWKVVNGNCLHVLKQVPDGCVDAVVTDPPYGLKFMGKKWDYKIPSVEVFAEMFRVLKDGSRLLCFGGARTHHRIWCNIEDAGFTIEDTVMWLYGSGFPKHKSKLKPAFEPICVARKGGVSELNIDACRIEGSVQAAAGSVGFGAGRDDGCVLGTGARFTDRGRWPANVVLDEEAARLLDEQSGTLTSGANPSRRNSPKFQNSYGAFPGEEETPARGADIGGASRFFYCAKASRSEREAGLETAPKRNGGSNAKGFTDDVAAGQDRNRPVGNHHPTVKPVALMRHLVKLITPVDGLVLDPYCGSGTTGTAAVLEGFNFVGIEIDEAYAMMAHRRIEHWEKL